MRPGPAPLKPLLILFVLAAPALAGCTDRPGQDPPLDREWTNPYSFDLHFDGAAAYDLVLAQLYENPQAKTGPRYRIPGTATLEAVATELHGELDESMKASGGRASLVRFDGGTYYALDLTPVRSSLCASDSPARDRVREIEFVNVVGRTDPEEIGLIIGAHFDSKRHTDPGRDPDHAGQPILGADDGASGTAMVVELARAFAEDPPGIPLTFVLFDGEDGFEREDCHPLAGSLHFAQNIPPAQQDTVLGMILLDMVGNASARFFREGFSQRYVGQDGVVNSAWLGDKVWETASDMGVVRFEDRSTATISDDHIPFLYEGIPSLDVIRYENAFAPYWHTTRDDHTAVQAEGLDEVGNVVEATVRRLALDEFADA